MRMKEKSGDRIFNIINNTVFIVMAIITLYPFIYVLAISLNDSMDTMAGGIYFLPRKWSLDSYYVIFRHNSLLYAFFMSVLRTFTGTVLCVVSTAMLGYALTKKYLVGYKFFYMLFIVSMFLNGGLIPNYMLFKNIHIYNSFAVYILPGLIGVFYMIIFRTNFMQIPGSMLESAYIDGANEFQVFIRIVMPLSVPILATVGLFSAVQQWNSWTDTLYFTSSPKLETLQFVLMKILRQSEAAQMVNSAQMDMLRRKRMVNISPESVKMAITIVATLPILFVYPFVQKYFIKGMMIGAVKE